MTASVRCLLLASAVLVACAPGVQAQQVDYEALQQTVGEPVTTSVTGKPQRQSDTPASTIIITREQIDRSPAKDVPGLLKTYAGIDVNRWTAGQSDVAVRGGVQTYNPRLLVLVNGRQVYLDHYGMTDWNLLGIQLEEVRQIELVRGPSGALFGFNAASGVVNIITDDPLSSPRVTASIEGGNHDYRRLAGAISVPVGSSVGVRLSGGHMREGERRIPSDQLQPTRSGDVSRDELSTAMSVAIDPQTSLTISGGLARNEQLELLVTQIASRQRYATENAGLRIDRDTSWGGLSASVYANWLDARYGLGANDPGAMPIAALQTFQLSAVTTVAQTSALFSLGDDTARLGLEYRHNSMDSGISFSRTIEYTALAANAMYDKKLDDHVTLNVAGRLDRLSLGQSGALARLTADVPADFDRSFLAFSFNAGLQARLDERQSLRINGGRAVQAPSLVVFGMNVPVSFVGVPLPVLVAGDPRIKPVTVWSAEAAYDIRLSEQAEFKSAAFFTRTNDAISYPGDDPVLELQPRFDPFLVTRVANVGSFTTYGLELSGQGAITPMLNWRANYTLTETNDTLPGTSPAIKYSLAPSLGTARHKANFILDGSRGSLSASIAMRYTSATRQISTRPDTFLALLRVEPALALDAKFSVRMGKRFGIWLAGENLTNASGATGSPLPGDTRVRSGVKLAL
ncbi:TonB-dependent receptor [Sphingomonas sp. BK069]|uniref:TonB-dependent receptor n=1 Tax=Sphingomonas sp. BK069 TaxID=2586979 RepID=UPI00160AFD0E|nr:TonB-dependent receptor [Sphingomonas sp. BK069]MBB3349859.1 iron complex outermembrane receptor protein [Sphingomonas sp. BK069]